MKTVLFACVHNAGRSQMACAMFNLLVDPSQAKGVSAGTQPGERVHPECVAAMSELGLDMSHEKPKLLTPELAAEANFLVTMGCGEACPHVPGLVRQDWPLEDPKGKSPEKVKEIRDKVKEHVVEFLARQGWERKDDAPAASPVEAPNETISQLSRVELSD